MWNYSDAFAWIHQVPLTTKIHKTHSLVVASIPCPACSPVPSPRVRGRGGADDVMWDSGRPGTKQTSHIIYTYSKVLNDVERLPDAVERIQKSYLGQVMCVWVCHVVTYSVERLCCTQSEYAIMQTSPISWISTAQQKMHNKPSQKYNICTFTSLKNEGQTWWHWRERERDTAYCRITLICIQ